MPIEVETAGKQHRWIWRDCRGRLLAFGPIQTKIEAEAEAIEMRQFLGSRLNDPADGHRNSRRRARRRKE